MKIYAISPLISAKKIEILQFVGNCDHGLVILPGNAMNHPCYKEIKRILKPGVFAFVETGLGKGDSIPWLVSSTKEIQMPNQIFATSPKATDLDCLQKVWPDRTHQIYNRRVSFAICGEIDGFAKDGSVKSKRQLPYDILANPTHTTRGRWNHLGPKLSNLSLGTVVIHVANNDYNHHNVTTNVRIYMDGEILPRYNKGKIGWSACKI